MGIPVPACQETVRALRPPTAPPALLTQIVGTLLSTPGITEEEEDRIEEGEGEGLGEEDLEKAMPMTTTQITQDLQGLTQVVLLQLLQDFTRLQLLRTGLTDSF